MTPFFGNPAASAQGVKGRKALARTYEDTWLDSFIKGVFGEEAPAGSVLEEGRPEKVAANEAGQRAGIFTDLAGPAKAGLSAATIAALPMLQSVLRGGVKNVKGQTGAIRIGGAKDLVATHAFDINRAERIADSGFLKAPSIGVHAREPNDYGAASPQFVFRAGAIDPAKQPGTMVNRDGYFDNPRSSTPAALKAEISEMLILADRLYGGKDTRNLQTWPGASQGLSIAASPSFRSFAEFEKSPFGAQLLRKTPKEREQAWRSLESDISAHRRETGLAPQALVRKVNKQGLQALDEDELRLWHEAMNVPSAMAEFKMHDLLKLNPNDAFVHVPTNRGIGREDLQKLAPLRDAGFKMVSAEDLYAPGFMQSFRSAEPYKNLPKIATPQGTFNFPGSADFNTQAWKDFINPGAGGSVPLAKAPGMLGDELKNTAKYFEQMALSEGKGIQELLLDHHDMFTVKQADQLYQHFKDHPNFGAGSTFFKKSHPNEIDPETLKTPHGDLPPSGHSDLGDIGKVWEPQAIPSKPPAFNEKTASLDDWKQQLESFAAMVPGGNPMEYLKGYPDMPDDVWWHLYSYYSKGKMGIVPKIGGLGPGWVPE